jgi:hypothetical protein
METSLLATFSMETSRLDRLLRETSLAVMQISSLALRIVVGRSRDVSGGSRQSVQQATIS